MKHLYFTIILFSAILVSGFSQVNNVEFHFEGKDYLFSISPKSFAEEFSLIYEKGEGGAAIIWFKGFTGLDSFTIIIEMYNFAHFVNHDAPISIAKQEFGPKSTKSKARIRFLDSRKVLGSLKYRKGIHAVLFFQHSTLSTWETFGILYNFMLNSTVLCKT